MDVRKAIVALASGPILTGSALAEGGRIVLDCSHLGSCSEHGDCRDDAGRITFRLTPIEVGRHGEGTYRIDYRDVSSEADWMTQFGPIRWAEGRDDLQLLLFAGAENLVWQSMSLTEPPGSTFRFLSCEEAE